MGGQVASYDAIMCSLAAFNKFGNQSGVFLSGFHSHDPSLNCLNHFTMTVTLTLAMVTSRSRSRSRSQYAIKHPQRMYVCMYVMQIYLYDCRYSYGSMYVSCICMYVYVAIP